MFARTMSTVASAVFVASLSLALFASPAHAAWKSFKALKLFVSDTVDAEASVFSQKGHFLVQPGDSEFTYVLKPKAHTVYRAASAEIMMDGKPALELATIAEWEAIGILEKTGPALSWSDDVGRYALSAKPPLLGAVTLEALRDYTDKYEFDIDEYKPIGDHVSTLAAISEPTEIVVGFGMWCSICAEWLPRFIKTVEAANNDAIRVVYLSINEDLDMPADELDTYGIDSVPSFVIRQDGSEVGRIDTEYIDYEGDAPMEKMLVDQLNAQ